MQECVDCLSKWRITHVGVLLFIACMWCAEPPVDDAIKLAVAGHGTRDRESELLSTFSSVVDPGFLVTQWVYKPSLGQPAIYGILTFLAYAFLGTVVFWTTWRLLRHRDVKAWRSMWHLLLLLMFSAVVNAGCTWLPSPAERLQREHRGFVYVLGFVPAPANNLFAPRVGWLLTTWNERVGSHLGWNVVAHAFVILYVVGLRQMYTFPMVFTLIASWWVHNTTSKWLDTVYRNQAEDDIVLDGHDETIELVASTQGQEEEEVFSIGDPEQPPTQEFTEEERDAMAQL